MTRAMSNVSVCSFAHVQVYYCACHQLGILCDDSQVIEPSTNSAPTVMPTWEPAKQVLFCSNFELCVEAGCRVCKVSFNWTDVVHLLRYTS